MENVVRGILEYELPYLKKYAKMMDVLTSNINTINYMLTHTTIKLPRNPPPSMQKPILIEKHIDVPRWVSMFVYALPYVDMDGIILDDAGITMSFRVPTNIYDFSPVSMFINLDTKIELGDIIVLSTLSDDVISLIAETIKKVSVDTYKNLERVLEIADAIKGELELDNTIDIDPSSFYEPLTDHDKKHIRAISTFVGQILETSTDMPYKVRSDHINFVFPQREILDMYNRSMRMEKIVRKNVKVPDWLADFTNIHVDRLKTVTVTPTSISFRTHKIPNETNKDGVLEYVAYIESWQARLDYIMISHYLLDDNTRKWIDDTLYELVLLSERVKEKIKDLAVLV
ncbi:MAG: hypothetical protein JHC26_11520, partial [Thermofilum sp.]|uniref:hypothetical protein n=1 Tax=Thermofilum sp. TaxID=1961369 RepID=UPI00258E5F8C